MNSQVLIDRELLKDLKFLLEQPRTKIDAKYTLIYGVARALEAHAPIPDADHIEPVRAMVVPDGLTLMPRALTAENGAKAAMLGEFVIRLERHCSSCADEAGDLSCDECGGDVEYVESVPVDWPTIKDIYAKAVDLLAASPAPGDSQWSSAR